MARAYLGTIPNPHVRDSQRKRVYEAEERCTFWSSFDILPFSKVESLVTSISQFFNIKSPSIDIGDPDYFSTAYATASTIVLPFPLTKSVPFICHEMSHVINYQLGPADHHGPNFAKAYLEVIKQFMGEQEYRELKDAFTTFNVKYKEVILI